jgi:hypothetical protein
MIQIVYWIVGIFVGIMTIGAATARVVGALADFEKAMALLQRDVEHLTESVRSLEAKLEAATRSE